MAATRCIVRAYADEPLDRLALAFEKKLVFIVRSTGVDSGDNVEHSGAIGFPSDRVFEFDAVLFDKLLEAYLLSDDAEALWAKAKPLEANLPQLERVRS